MGIGSTLVSPSRGSSGEPGGTPRPGSSVEGGALPCRSIGSGDLVRVAIIEPHDLVVAGLEQVLSGTPAGRYQVATADAWTAADVTLYGVHPGDEASSHDPQLHALLRATRSVVIATHWDDSPPVVEAALRCGAHGALSKRLPGDQLLAEIERILGPGGPRRPPPPESSCHPEIARTGLTRREVEVLSLVAGGLTNQEIADQLYLTINTVKTYIRLGYRKIGAKRRSHAVIWVERHGLTARRT